MNGGILSSPVELLLELLFSELDSWLDSLSGGLESWRSCGVTAAEGGLF
jgi:hypothetical protein